MVAHDHDMVLSTSVIEMPCTTVTAKAISSQAWSQKFVTEGFELAAIIVDGVTT